MVKTFKKGLLAVVLAFVALFALASCVLPQQPTTDPTKDAQTALDTFTGKVTFANSEAVTTSFNLPISGKQSEFNIPISWTSSNEEVIAVVDLMENGAASTYYKQAKVTRPAFDKEDATVTLTADFSLTYTKNDGTSATLKAQKTYTFVVLKETSEIASGNLAAIKAAAAKFYFEENGVAAGTSSPKELEFPVEFDATVTAVLAAEGTGQFTVSDGSAGIYVYSNKTAVKVGDKVHVKGSITTYYGTLQVGANIEVTVLGDSDQTVEFKPTTPGAINAISTADGMFGGQTINVAGKLLYGKYNNGSNDSFWLEDVQTGSQIEIYYKSYSADEKTMLQGFVGKYVEMNAVTYDTYSSSAPNDHRIFAVASTIKEATAPELSDADKLAAAVNKVKAVSLAALYVNGQDFAFPVVDGGEGVTIAWAMDPATLLVDGKLVVTENGTAKLVATVVVAELSETVELTINVATEAKEEPVVTAKTIAELIALTTEMDAKYTVSGKIVAFGNKLDSTETTAVKYGNLIIADEAGNKIIVYGATATESALTFDAATGKYTYKNAQDFLTNAVTKDIVVGDTVELVVVRTSYNGNPQLNAIVTKVIKGEGGDTPVDPEQPETPVAGVLELTAAKLGLGAYADGSKAVDGVEFSFIELGDYGNGIQMRNKSKASTLWNTTALPGTIKNIVLVYNSAKSTYDNTDALVFTFGNDATLAGGTVKLSTVSGQSTYTVTPDADNYTFFKVAINITYSMYWDSITINYEGGSTTPEAPKHEHVACPTCGKCTAADCDGAAEDKCPGHTTEPEGPVAGSAELPFTATQAAEETAKLADKVASTDKYYVTGTVKSITEISTSYGNGTFVITDGTTDFIIFRAKYLENAKFTSEDQLAVGDTVVVYGQLINYGGTLEMNSGCYLTAHTKAETPETPKHEHVVCPECGKCTAEDCDGAAEDKCPGHTTEPETPAASSLELTAAKLGLGAYADGTKTVDGVDFGFIELGDFGNGIQMRNKTKASSLWNATALPKAIKNIVLVYNSAKSTYNNADAFTFLFGTDATVAAGTVKLSTVSGQSTYTVTPDAETYTFFKMTLNLSYSFYWDSITINYVDGTSEPVNPDTPHVHTEEVLPAKEATCTETGLTEGKKCSECGEILVAQEEVAAKGHSFAEGKCTVCGADDPDYVAPEQPETPVVTVNKADLETLNGGTHSSSYATNTSTAGWVAANAAINSGNDNATATVNPSFGILGDGTVRAVTLNGKTSAVGSLTSPILENGIKKLSFKYTNLFSDTAFSVTVNIKDASGAVLATKVVSYENPNKVKYEVRVEEWTLETQVQGQFQIEFVNNCPTAQDSNKDRATIWNITWENADPAEPVVTSGVLTFDDVAKRTSIDDEHQTWEENGVVVTINKNTSTSNINGNYYNPVRVYKSHELVAKSEKAFNKVIITVYYNNGADTYIKALAATTVPTGATMTNAEAVFTYELAEAATSFAIVMDNAQVRVVSVELVFAGGAAPEAPEHTHTEEVLAAKEATCTETGLTEGKKCSTCGEILVAQEEVAAKGHTEEVLAAKEATCSETGLTEGKKCSVCGEVLVAQEEVAATGAHVYADYVCNCGAVDKTLLDEFAKQIVDLFNSTGANDAKVTTREDFKATTHPNIKYVWNKAENLEAYKWLFELALEEITAAATENAYLDNDYYTNIKGLLEKMIAGDTAAVGGDYADGRTILRWWIQGVINAYKAPADDVYVKLMVDYSKAENLVKFLKAYAASKEVKPAGFQGEPAGTIAVGCYSNTGLASGIYFCDNAGVTPNNSLRWQYKLVLKYDAEKDAYLVVAADAAKASATSAAGSADAWTHAIASASENVTTLATVGQYIVVEEELSTEMAAFTAKVYNADQWA